MQLKNLLPAMLVLLSGTVYAGEPKAISSDLKNVTVYRSGAELIHNASAQLPAGNTELVIDGISNAIDINSVQVNCPSIVTILGVEFANNYLTIPEVNTKIKVLKDSAETIQTGMDKIDVQLSTFTDLLDVLRSNKEIKGMQTGLSVAELMKMMDYYKNKSSELQNDIAAQKDKKKKLSELLARITNQLHEEENKNTRNTGQIRLQLSTALAGKYDFTVSYITPNAYWTPCYDIRVDDIKSPLKVIYKAKVVQTTGIDWKKVKLSLSTSVPNQWGNAPVLKSWFLSYINPVNVMDKALASNSIQGMLQGRAAGVNALSEVVVTGYAQNNEGYKEKTEIQPVYIVNGAPMSFLEFKKLSPSVIKNKEFLKSDAASTIYGSQAAGGAYIITLKDGLNDYVSVADNELNVTFDIDLPYDVPTNGKEQTATLKEYTVGSQYKYYSVPRLDKDAYLLAEVPDWEKLNLLPGDANIIFEGTYVGKSFIDPNSTFDTLNLTLGRDKRMVVKKEKMADYSSVRFMGSNKLQKITYEITVKNNKKDTVHMLLKDQYPLSTLKEIEVELIDNGGGSVNTDIGVLTWKLELSPGESKKIRFAYSVKYPKDKSLNIN
jgi:hypothetical protein